MSVEAMREHATITGDGNTATWKSNGRDWVCLAGTFDGATVAIQASPDNGTTWVQISDDASFTDATWHAFQLPPGVLMRAVSSSSSSGTSISLFV